MNLYNLKQRKLEKMREKQIMKEIYHPSWKISENSKKIINTKFQNEKPIYDRALEIAEKKKRVIENNARENELKQEGETQKLKTKWNSGHNNEEAFHGFVEKQKLWGIMKETRVLMLKEEYEKRQKEAIQASLFKPKVTYKSKSIAKTDNTKKVHERLYDYSEELKNKKIANEKKEKKKFIPNINTKIPNYIKNRKKEINNQKNLNNRQINHQNTNLKHLMPVYNEENYCENENDTNENYIGNLVEFLDVENKTKEKGSITHIKDNINKSIHNENNKKNESASLNRKQSAQIKLTSQNLTNSILKGYINNQKNEKELKHYDLYIKGLKSDLNNLNAGNNSSIKLLMNEKGNKKDNVEVNFNQINDRENFYREMSNRHQIKKTKKLADKLPLHRFSVPITDIVNQNSFKDILIKDEILNENSNLNNIHLNKNLKKHRNTSIENISKIKNQFENENIKKNSVNPLNQSEIITNNKSQNEDIIINKINNKNTEYSEYDNKLLFEPPSDTFIKKRFSAPVVNNKVYNDFMFNSMVNDCDQSNADFNVDNKTSEDDLHFAYEKRGTLNQNEAFLFQQYKNALQNKGLDNLNLKIKNKTPIYNPYINISHLKNDDEILNLQNNDIADFISNDQNIYILNVNNATSWNKNRLQIVNPNINKI